MNKLRPLLYTSALSVFFAAALWSTVSFVAEEIGTPPTESKVTLENAELEKLRIAAEKDKTLPNLRAYAAALAKDLTSTQSPDQRLLIEMLDTLQAMTEIDPNDKQALVTLANIAYNHQAFEKAADNFQKYLKLVPDDQQSRVTYGSTLTFIGRFEEAESELKAVIDKSPQIFAAHASLAINYAAMGREQEAFDYVTQNKQYAPDPESVVKLEEFLRTLISKKEEFKTAKSESLPNTVEGVLRAHPIVGPKIVGITVEGTEFRVSLREFPMSAMPQFAKDKFYSGLQDSLGRLSPTPSILIFIDEASDKEMDRLAISPSN